VVAAAQAYYAFGRTLEPTVYAAAVAAASASASGHAEALGVDPASAVRTLAGDVAVRLSDMDHEQVVQSAAGGMRLSAWLATRTFELTVQPLTSPPSPG
jgi:DNA-binding SARP family transcriptional activator